VGAWAGWGEPKIQRHIQDHVHRHLKGVAERTFHAFKRLRFDRLIVGTPEGREGKIYPLLERHLHNYLRARLAGVFPGEPDMSEHALKRRALEVARAHERREEERLISRLLEESQHREGLGVLGIGRVIPALMLGQVHTLGVDHTFRAPGRVCPRDHYLSLADDRCPLCGGSSPGRRTSWMRWWRRPSPRGRRWSMCSAGSRSPPPTGLAPCSGSGSEKGLGCCG